MPRLSRFFGITISMYHNDHSPPHFHAKYAGSEASFAIDTLEQVEGQLHRRARAMVLEWASLHRSELWESWEKAREGLPLAEIDPLD